MSVAVLAERLGKRYAIGRERVPYRTLRDTIAHAARQLVRPDLSEDRSYLWAVRDVSFELPQGQVLGIIGPNGAGKSTLLKLLARITEPTEGRAVVVGRVGALLEVGTGFHSELTGRENILLSGAILGMSRANIRRRFDEIVEFAEVERFLDTPVKHYSTGMQMRLAFAVAAHFEPDILVIDEVLAVGDAEFQRRCLGKLHSVSREGRTALFVSHNMHAIRTLCDRAIELRLGRIVKAGSPDEVVADYLASSTGGRAEVRWTDEEGQPGDQRVRLLAMRVTDAAGRLQRILHSSSPAYVEMEVDLRELHPALTVGFEVGTLDGVLLFWTYHTDSQEADWPPLRRGRNVLRCVLPAGLLNGGTYTLSPRIALHYTEWIVNSDPVLSFEVTLDHSRSPLWLIPRPGVVAPALRWEVR